MSALDGWPAAAVVPWLFRRSSELVTTRTWCTITARKTTRATTTSWPLRTRSAATAIRIPEHPCSSLTLSAPENAFSDATAGSAVCFSIRSSRRRCTLQASSSSLSLSREIALRICRSWTTSAQDGTLADGSVLVLVSHAISVPIFSLSLQAKLGAQGY